MRSSSLALVLALFATPVSAQDAAPSATASSAAGDAAQRRAYRIAVETAEGLSVAEAGWALDWALTALNAECAGPGPIVESHPLELRVDARGRATVRGYEGPSAPCVVRALRQARFPLGHAATVHARLSILSLEAGIGFGGGHGGGGSGSGISWQGPSAPRGGGDALTQCRGERPQTYDVQITIAADGTLGDARAVRPSGAAASCVVAAIRSLRFARPSGAPEGPITLRLSLTVGPPMRLGGFGGR